MGWFSKKKKQTGAELPTIPRFPQQGQMPSYQRERQVPPPRQHPEFPDIQPRQEEHAQPREVEYKPQDTRESPEIYYKEPLAKPPETALMDRDAPEHPEQPSIGELPKREPGFMRRYPQREAIVNGIERDIPLTDPAVQAAQTLKEKREQNQHTEPKIQPRQLNQPPKTQTTMQPSATEDKPLFVKIGQYREATTNITQLKQKISEIEQLLTQLETIKTQEQTEIDTAKTNLQEIKEKLLAIDKQLFEA